MKKDLTTTTEEGIKIPRAGKIEQIIIYVPDVTLNREQLLKELEHDINIGVIATQEEYKKRLLKIARAIIIQEVQTVEK